MVARQIADYRPLPPKPRPLSLREKREQAQQQPQPSTTAQGVPQVVIRPEDNPNLDTTRRTGTTPQPQLLAQRAQPTTTSPTITPLGQPPSLFQQTIGKKTTAYGTDFFQQDTGTTRTTNFFQRAGGTIKEGFLGIKNIYKPEPPVTTGSISIRPIGGGASIQTTKQETIIPREKGKDVSAMRITSERQLFVTGSGLSVVPYREGKSFLLSETSTIEPIKTKGISRLTDVQLKADTSVSNVVFGSEEKRLQRIESMELGYTPVELTMRAVLGKKRALEFTKGVSSRFWEKPVTSIGEIGSGAMLGSLGGYALRTVPSIAGSLKIGGGALLAGALGTAGISVAQSDRRFYEAGRQSEGLFMYGLGGLFSGAIKTPRTFAQPELIKLQISEGAYGKPYERYRFVLDKDALATTSNPIRGVSLAEKTISPENWAEGWANPREVQTQLYPKIFIREEVPKIGMRWSLDKFDYEPIPPTGREMLLQDFRTMVWGQKTKVDPAVRLFVGGKEIPKYQGYQRSITEYQPVKPKPSKSISELEWESLPAEQQFFKFTSSKKGQFNIISMRSIRVGSEAETSLVKPERAYEKYSSPFSTTISGLSSTRGGSVYPKIKPITSVAVPTGITAEMDKFYEKYRGTPIQPIWGPTEKVLSPTKTKISQDIGVLPIIEVGQMQKVRRERRTDISTISITDFDDFVPIKPRIEPLTDITPRRIPFIDTPPPPIIPGFRLFGSEGSGESSKKRYGRKRGYRYTPSGLAIFFGISGRVKKKGMFTGGEIRPIPISGITRTTTRKKRR